MPLTSVGTEALLTAIGLVLVGLGLSPCIRYVCSFGIRVGLFQYVSSTFSGGGGDQGRSRWHLRLPFHPTSRSTTKS